MKKVVSILIIIVIILTGCGQTSEKLNNEIKLLRTEKAKLVEELNNINDALKTAKEKLPLVEHKATGGEVKYILTLELKQSHFTLDLGQHLKDAVNKIEFDIAVDKELYEQQKVGDELLRDFREGSFWIAGSIGDWVITVKDKHEQIVK